MTWWPKIGVTSPLEVSRQGKFLRSPLDFECRIGGEVQQFVRGRRVSVEGFAIMKEISCRLRRQ